MLFGQLVLVLLLFGLEFGLEFLCCFDKLLFFFVELLGEGLLERRLFG